MFDNGNMSKCIESRRQATNSEDKEDGEKLRKEIPRLITIWTEEEEDKDKEIKKFFWEEEKRTVANDIERSKTNDRRTEKWKLHSQTKMETRGVARGEARWEFENTRLGWQRTCWNRLWNAK